MKNLLILTGIVTASLMFSNAAWATQRSCEDGEMKKNVCEMVNAESTMVGSASDLIDSACNGKSGSKSCENAKRRMGKLKVDVDDTHDENEALEEADYVEMIESPYKGRGKKRDDGEGKSCQAKNIDAEARDDYLAELEIESFDSTCTDCTIFFNRKDEDKADDDKCNSWKALVLDEAGDKAGVLHISERQENLCPVECKGKKQLIDKKKERFGKGVDTSIAELGLASEEMQNESVRLDRVRLAADTEAVEEDDCAEAETEQPIHAHVIAASFTVVNAAEWVAEVCEPPADQTIAGFNASGACLLPVTVLQIAKEVHDVLNLFNDEFQGEQVTHIQECAELLSVKIDDLEGQMDAMDAKLDAMSETLDEVRLLVITPQGQRESGDTEWPNKK